MSRSIFSKAIRLVSIPVVVAIATTTQKPASALPASAQAISHQATHSFRLTNGQAQSVDAFYVSPSSVYGWKEDLLESATILPNRSVQIAIHDNRASCYYDFQALFSDGSSVTHYGIDICQLDSYTF